MSWLVKLITHSQINRTGHKVIRKSIHEQFNYIWLDIMSIHTLLDSYEGLPFSIETGITEISFCSSDSLRATETNV